MRRFIPRALRNGAYARLLTSTTLSQFGSTMTYIALPLLAWEQSGSGAVFAMVIIGGNIGELISYPFGGVIADRFDRRHVGMAGDAISMVLVGAILATVLHEAWALLALVQLVQNAVHAMTDSAAPALRRDIVHDDDRTQSTALLQVALNSSTLAAPLAGAAIYATWGFGVVIVVDFLTFAISFLLLAGLRHPRTRAAHPEASGPADAAPTSALRRTGLDLRDGVRASRRDPFVALWMLMMLASGIANGLFITSLVPWLDRSIGGMSASFGPLIATFGGSGLLAGLVMARVGDRIAPALIFRVGALGWGGGAIAMIGSPPLSMVFVGFALIGSMGTASSVAMTTLIQRRVPSHLIGRITSLSMCSMLIGSTIATAVAGWLIDHADPQLPMSGAGVAFMVSAATMIAIARHTDTPAPLMAEIDAPGVPVDDADLAVSG